MKQERGKGTMSLLLLPICAILVNTALAAEPPKGDARPLPQWVKDLHEKEFLGYKFELPATVIRGHPRLPHPSAKVLEFYRQHKERLALVYTDKYKYDFWITRDPLLMYKITGDKQELTKLLGWVKAPPADDTYRTWWAYFGKPRLLDWCYDELAPEARQELAQQCAEAALHEIKYNADDFAPTQTFWLNRMGLRSMELAIAGWGETPKGEEALKQVHAMFFRDCVPIWKFSLGGDDGGGFGIPLGYNQNFHKVLMDGMTVWSSFMGEDLFRKYEAWLRPFGYESVYRYMPNIAGDPLGDVGGNMHELIVDASYLLADRYDDPYMRWIAWRFARPAKTEVELRPYAMRTASLHYYEVDNTGRKFQSPEEGLPPERFMGSTFGAVFMRSDWTEDATYAIFKVGDMATNHAHNDGGMFYIYKYGDLAIDAGRWSWKAPGNLYRHPHYKGFTSLAVAHNCLTVRDPEDKFVPNDGGQRAVCSTWMGSPVSLDHYLKNRDIYETGDMLAYDPQAEYVYSAGDLVAAYQCAASGQDTSPAPDRSKAFSRAHMHRTKRLEAMTRAFLFIRPDYFVIFDRVVATQPEFEKKWLLQMVHEPEIAGDTATILRDDRVTDKYGVMINRIKGVNSYDYQYHGKMYSRTLLPRDFQIGKVGGPGKYWWDDGRNWDDFYESDLKIEPDPTDPKGMGGWRIEVSPKEKRKEDLFLHVIQVGDSKGLDKMVPVDYAEQGNLVGCKIRANGGEYTVLFDKTDGIGGHIVFEKDGKKVVDRDLAEKLMPNRKPAGLEPAVPAKQ